MNRNQKITAVVGFLTFVGSLFVMPYEWHARETPDLHRLSIAYERTGVIRRPFYAPPSSFDVEVSRMNQPHGLMSLFDVDAVRMAPERMLVPWLLILSATIVGIIVLHRQTP